MALRLTSDWKAQQFSQLNDFSLILLVRARNYAISSRSDIDWNGAPISSEQQRRQKQLEMEEDWVSLELFDWYYLDESTTSKCKNRKKQEINIQYEGNTIFFFPTQIQISKPDTQSAVERLSNKYPNLDWKKICCINMANAHHVGGGYQFMSGSQEENVGGNSNLFVILGNVGQICEEGDRKGRTLYQNGWHIPPGGNYFHNLRFLTSNHPLRSACITHAFADFRKRQQ